jgi:hypothetical protein
MVRNQFRSIYTHVFCRVTEVETTEQQHRVTVAVKDDERVEIDNIPVASPYTGDGFGERYPISKGSEGILCILKDPIDEYLTERGFLLETVAKQRQHHIRDGFFLPRVYYDDDTVPTVDTILDGAAGPTGYDAGEYLLWHESDSRMRISSDSTNGVIDIIHNGGHYLHLSDQVGIRIRNSSGDEVHLDGGAVVRSNSGERIELSNGARIVHPNGHTVSVTDSDTAEATVERADGSTVDVRVSRSEVSLSLPDEYNDHATDPRATLSADDAGQTTVDGRTAIGDADAYRVDRTTENTDSDDPRDYQEVGEPVEPILDPSDDAETEYDNPASVDAVAPVDHGFFEIRRHVPERRMKDPDPTVTDETDPRYVEVPDAWRTNDTLPVGYTWINLSTAEKKMIDTSGSIVVTQTL